MKISRTSPRRCRQMPPIDTAPASAQSSRISSTWRGSSLMPGHQRGDQHAGGDPGAVELGHRLDALARVRRVRLAGAPRLLVERGDREVGGEARDLLEQLEVAQQQRRLGEHRAGRARVAHGLPDAGQQLVALLDPLVGIGVGAQRHVLVLPARPEQLRPRELGRVDLDDDLALEVPAGVEVEVGVGGAGEAKKQAWVHPRYGLIVHRNGIRDAFGTRFRIDFA